MRTPIVCLACFCCLSAPLIALAQTPADPPAQAQAQAQAQNPSSNATTSSDAQVQLPPASVVATYSSSFWSPFVAIPHDFKHFFSADTARILGVASAGVMVAHRWDDDGIALSLGRLKPAAGAFRPGNIGGGMMAQLGGGFILYSVAKATGWKPGADLGNDLFRAQVVTQAIVQPMKVVVHRDRPDGSSHYSMPSGHTAAAVATATVLQRRFGWKIGIPAYTASAYVGMSRMSANKHHLTDVMVGAAIGLASARTVTIGPAKWNLGVAPTAGGAAVTITKQ